MNGASGSRIFCGFCFLENNLTKAIKSAAAIGTAVLMAVPAAAPIHLNTTGVTVPDLSEGAATWYGFEFHGRETASGEIYNMYDLTAAHRDLPLGTRVRVINLENQKSVVVRINDRGPWVFTSTIDLSFGAAEKLAMVRRGRVNVRIEPLPVVQTASLRRASYSRN